MRWLKTVIHVHTNYSFDANPSPAEVIDTACRQGVDCVGITDHDTIDGALEAREIGGVRVIVGEEISSADGHIIGLFLSKRIAPGLSLEETAAEIRAQGGLILAPHPFTILCEGSLHNAIGRLRPWLDAIEICNAQDFLPWENSRAGRYARRYAITPYVGADSHVRGYLATCYQEIPEFDGPAGFLGSLRQARLYPGRFGCGYFVQMGWRHVWDSLARRRWKDYGANVSRRTHTAPVG